jgi:hypothetical protein
LKVLATLAPLAAAMVGAALVAAAPAERKLTIAYTGDVWGEVGPCG